MAAKIQEIKNNLDETLHDEKTPWCRLLGFIEKKTGVARIYVFLGFIALIGNYLMFGYGAQFLCNIIGFLYPAFTSMKAIESRERDTSIKWLTYWVVFAFFSQIEFFADTLVMWCPFYWLLKCFFLIWLMIPNDCNGSVFIYKQLIRPYFLKYQDVIDETITNIKDSASNFVQNLE